MHEMQIFVEAMTNILLKRLQIPTHVGYDSFTILKQEPIHHKANTAVPEDGSWEMWIKLKGFGVAHRLANSELISSSIFCTVSWFFDWRWLNARSSNPLWPTLVRHQWATTWKEKYESSLQQLNDTVTSAWARRGSGGMFAEIFRDETFPMGFPQLRGGAN